jgi:hypothetical protein
MLNLDLSTIGEADLLVKVGHNWLPSTGSQSIATVKITDHCPSGYKCEDLEIHECLKGTYC